MKKIFTLMAVCLLFARPIISLFVDDPAVIELGVRFLRCASLFYLIREPDRCHERDRQGV